MSLPASDAPDPAADHVITDQLARVIHRVKQSMNYRGSFSTRDILGSLVARWIASGEWQRLKALPPEERRLGESVRRFILDRFDQLRRRGHRAELEVELEVPDEATLAELVELAELRAWVAARVDELARGEVDARVRIPLARPAQVGEVLARYLGGKTQREIATELGVSLGAVNKRLAEGQHYLVVLQSIEHGLVPPPPA